MTKQKYPDHMKAKRCDRMNTIYLDVLFCVNFIIDYLLLLFVKTFLSLPCRLRRLLLGAAVGGIMSFVILLPPLPSGLSILISFAGASVVVGAAFSPLSVRCFFKAAAAFFLSGFAYCGIMMAIWTIFSSDNILIRNSSVYIGISPTMLVVTALFSYAVLRVIMRITGRGKITSDFCTVIVEFGTEKVTLNAKIDTGNTLKEPFSGLPVIVAVKGACKNLSLFKDTDINKLAPGLRIIPFTSVGGKGLIPAGRPDNVIIKHSGISRSACAYLAVCDDSLITDSVQALVPAEII